jgi:hypothetical protein
MYVEKINEILEFILPGCQYMIVGNDINKIVWNDKRPQPTKEEILAAIPEVEKSLEEKRREKYSSEIRESANSFIKKYFDIDLQFNMMVIYLQYLDKKITGINTKDDETPIKNIKEIWNWMAEINSYGNGIKEKAKNGKTLSPDEIDFEKLFGKKRPKIKFNL